MSSRKLRLVLLMFILSMVNSISGCGSSGDMTDVVWHYHGVVSTPTPTPTPSPGAPVITSVILTTPSAGNPFTITGSNFGISQGDVTFGGVSVKCMGERVITSWSDTQIEGVLPDTLQPSGDVVVTDSIGEGSAGFSYARIYGWRGATIVDGGNASITWMGARGGFDPRASNQYDGMVVWAADDSEGETGLFSRRFLNFAWENEANIQRVDIDNDYDVVGTTYEVKFDSNGNAMAVFNEDTGSYVRTMWSYYNVSTDSWERGTEYLNDSPTADSGDDGPDIEYGPDGNALCVFSQTDIAEGTGIHIIARLWSGGEWNMDPLYIDNSGSIGVDLFPRIAIDSNNNAFAVFCEDKLIFSTRYNAAGGWDADSWSDPVSLSTQHCQPFAEVDVDSQGNAMAVFQMQNPDGFLVFNICSSLYNGEDWQDVLTVSGNTGPEQTTPYVRYDANDNAIVVFTQIAATGMGNAPRVYFAHYSGGTWSEPVIIDGDLILAHQSSMPYLSFDPSATRACCTWTSALNTGQALIEANVYDSITNTWAEPRQIDAGTAFVPLPMNQIVGNALDSQFNAAAFWVENGRQYSNYYH